VYSDRPIPSSWSFNKSGEFARNGFQGSRSFNNNLIAILLLKNLHVIGLDNTNVKIVFKNVRSV
jgi:hypothetical protein